MKLNDFNRKISMRNRPVSLHKAANHKYAIKQKTASLLYNFEITLQLRLMNSEWKKFQNNNI